MDAKEFMRKNEEDRRGPKTTERVTRKLDDLVRPDYEESCRETLNHVNEDMRDLVSYDDLWNLVLWLERKADDIRNEAVSKLTDIGLEALKQLKNQL